MAAVKTTILVIINNPVERDLTLLALDRMHCNVITAENGSDAINAFETHRPQIILVDLFLPQMSGIEVIEKIKDTGKLALTTIIVISSLGFPEVVEQVKAAGAYDFLVKPFESELLIQRIKQALKRKR